MERCVTNEIEAKALRTPRQRCCPRSSIEVLKAGIWVSGETEARWDRTAWSTQAGTWSHTMRCTFKSSADDDDIAWWIVRRHPNKAWTITWCICNWCQHSFTIMERNASFPSSIDPRTCGLGHSERFPRLLQSSIGTIPFLSSAHTKRICSFARSSRRLNCWRKSTSVWRCDDKYLSYSRR